MRNIDKMYLLYGVIKEGEGICKNCRHFIDNACGIYGEKSGFAAYYPACGLFNQTYLGNPPSKCRVDKNASIRVISLVEEGRVS